MPNLVGWDLLYKSAEKDIQTKSDVLITVVHWQLLHAGMKCIGVGDDITSESNGESELLPDGWSMNKSSYALRYKYQNEVFVLLGMVFDDSIVLNLLNGKSKNVSNASFLLDTTVTAPSRQLNQLIPAIECVIQRLQNELLGPVQLGSKVSDTQTNSLIFWRGAFIFKKSLYPVEFHLLKGDPSVFRKCVEHEGNGQNRLHITQRLLLQQPKLHDILKRTITEETYGIFLAVNGSAVAHSDNFYTRYLCDLVNYLQKKDAAGVLLFKLPNNGGGVLYAFPPCDVSAGLLKDTCINLDEFGLTENHLVIICSQIK